MLTTAIDRLEGAIHEMKATRDQDATRSRHQDVPNLHARARALSVAITEAETALLWLCTVPPGAPELEQPRVGEGEAGVE